MTPTEELILEVLTARIRLGETCWTFDSKFTRQARALEGLGLVTWKSGIVEKTILVWPTHALLNNEEWFTPTYRLGVTL